MSGPEFFQTRMGQTFYEHTMPSIAKSLETIAKSLAPSKEPLQGTPPITDRERVTLDSIIAARVGLCNRSDPSLDLIIKMLSRILDSYGVAYMKHKGDF